LIDVLTFKFKQILRCFIFSQIRLQILYLLKIHRVYCPSYNIISIQIYCLFWNYQNDQQQPPDWVARDCDNKIDNFLNTLQQAWAILRYLVSIIYLDMNNLLPGAEILYSRTIYSLEMYSSTKKILVPTCDLQTGLIVLAEDLGIS
jgi:hypothetical protein